VYIVFFKDWRKTQRSSLAPSDGLGDFVSSCFGLFCRKIREKWNLTFSILALDFLNGGSLLLEGLGCDVIGESWNGYESNCLPRCLVRYFTPLLVMK
jgi:hypothetical protein